MYRERELEQRERGRLETGNFSLGMSSSPFASVATYAISQIKREGGGERKREEKERKTERERFHMHYSGPH
jgi:hypothetical protein